MGDIGKLFHYADPRLDQELARLYDFIQNGQLGPDQIDTRAIARLVGQTIGAGIPSETLNGQAIERESILANRLLDSIITGAKLNATPATRIHADATWTIGDEDGGSVREIDVQIDTVKAALTGVSSVVHLWASNSSNKNAAPPTMAFSNVSVTTGTLLSDLGSGVAELLLLCGTTTAGRLIVDVTVVGAQTLYFYLSSGPMISESGAVAWV